MAAAARMPALWRDLAPAGCVAAGRRWNSSSRGGILDRLAAGPVIGDGGFVFALEKRGFVKAGPWTPEATVEHPDAVRQLHREFLRAGSDVMHAFTYYASEDKLTNRGNEAGRKIGCDAINRAAASLAKQVASEGDSLTLGGISQTPSYLEGKGKEAVQAMLLVTVVMLMVTMMVMMMVIIVTPTVQAVFKKQIDVFVEEGLDFVLCEYFEHIEETEWAIEECLRSELPVAATMCIGPEGDLHGNSAAECAI